MTRVVHLGDGLDQEEFEQAAENVGQFLDLATATAGSLLFDSDGSRWAEMTVRTCGLCRIERTEEELEPAALNSCLERAAPRLAACGGSAPSVVDWYKRRRERVVPRSD